MEFLEVLDALELLRVMGTTPEPLRAGMGMAGWETGFFCSMLVGRDDSTVVGFVGSLTEEPLPGKGKWFKLGSVPTMLS